MTLTDLGVYIDRDQPKPFVNLYLTLLIEKYQLSVPTEMNVNELSKSWDKILSKYRSSFSDELCMGISKYWLSLLEQCDLQSNQLELDLFNAAGLKLEEKDPKEELIRMQKKSTPFDLPKKVPHQSDPLTSPHISEQYEQRKIVENMRAPEIDQLNTTYKKAFKTNDSTNWLIAHLTYVRYDQAKEVPKSTVPANIRAQWEEIIASEFDTISDDIFLTELTNEWFYLVNQKGIPTNNHQQEEILMTFLAKQQSNVGKDTSNKVQKKPSIFKRLFN